MAKSLSDRIAFRASTKNPSQAGKNRAAFLAVRDDVRHAMSDGWPVKLIWETLREEGKITFSYDAFNGYVNRLIRGTETTEPSSANPPSAKSVKTDTRAQKTAPKPVQPIGGFHFNPTPNKEELF